MIGPRSISRPEGAILADLDAVARLRADTASDRSLAARVFALKAYQHTRFGLTYRDLLASESYASAARFFLDELYGPRDFTERDAQFARVVPALVRLFPAKVVETVRSLSKLHALSEQLDFAMAGALDPVRPISCSAYLSAWQHVGQVASREAQINMMIEVGQALVHFTHNALLGHSLRLMREPARRAGLGALQQFLEGGFETFRALRRPMVFLDLIASRERLVVSALFEASSCASLPGEFQQAQQAFSG